MEFVVHPARTGPPETEKSPQGLNEKENVRVGEGTVTDRAADNRD
jgi:hypothetical protein